MPGICFGPSGNSDAFYQQGTSTWYAEMAARLGLDAFEYSFGHGVRIKTETAKRIGEEAKAYGIAMSAHAPASTSPYRPRGTGTKHPARDRSYRPLGAGATRVVVHPARPRKWPGRGPRKRRPAFLYILGIKREMGFDPRVLRMETMGRLSQLGRSTRCFRRARWTTYCPALDFFGHINARGRGSFKTQADYAAVFDAVENALGSDRS